MAFTEPANRLQKYLSGIRLESVVLVLVDTRSKWNMVIYATCTIINTLHFFLNIAALAAYGSFHARGGIRAAAAGLHHSYGNNRSRLLLLPTLQPVAVLDP